MPDHETIVVNEDNTHSIVLRDGDVVENKLIDITAPGASWAIDCWGDGWKLRNVGIEGKVDRPIGPKKGLRPGCPEDGHGLVENCYFSGRTSDMGWSWDFGNCWIKAKHAGHIDFRRVTVVDAADNGIYGTGPNKDDSPKRGHGTATIEKCHAENNGNGNFRLGGAGAEIVNSTVLIDGKTPPTTHPNPHGARGIVAEGADAIEVRNCDVSFQGTDGYGVAAIDSWTDTPIDVYDSRVTGPIGDSVVLHNSKHGANAANPTPHPGVPMTANQAAQGDLAARPSDAKSVTVQGVGQRGAGGFDYELRTSGGKIWPGEDASGQDRIHSSQTVAEGRVWAPWFDDFWVSPGTDIEVTTGDDRVLVTLDGEPIDAGVMEGVGQTVIDQEAVEKRARELFEEQRGELVDDISAFLDELTAFVEEYDDWGDEEK
jgi:hypothetical protein